MIRSASSSRPAAPHTPVASKLGHEEIAALVQRREARWRPGLPDQPLHTEIFANGADASGAGLALALACDGLRAQARASAEREDAAAQAEDRRPILWVQEARTIQRCGRLYLHGLPRPLRERVIHVEARTPEDALFAIEEGLKCRDLACVIAEIAGNPRALDFTASRRLSLTAERHGVALWLVRVDARADLSSARMRWRVETAPSAPARWNAAAPGAPRWQAELFRARRHAPGQWIISDGETALSARRPSCNHESDNEPDHVTALGPALARQRRLRSLASPLVPAAAPDSRHLVRATVGRSLAACARL